MNHSIFSLATLLLRGPRVPSQARESLNDRQAVNYVVLQNNILPLPLTKCHAHILIN